jgi:hypothetical protein
MNKEELERNLKYTEEKHRNDTVDTFDTDISMMCSDVLRVLKNCIEIPENATNGYMLLTMFDTATVYGIDKEKDCITICIDNNFYQKFKYSWWNEPYKITES